MSGTGSGADAGSSCLGDDVFQLSEDFQKSLALQDDQIEAIKDIFRDLDEDHNGSISLGELGAALRALGMAPTDDEVQRLMEQLDVDESGTIEFGEFAQMVSTKLREYDPEKELRSAFEVFDKDGDGRISRDELKAVVEQLGDTITDEDLDKMLEDADENSDGFLDYSEFVNIWFGGDDSTDADRDLTQPTKSISNTTSAATSNGNTSIS